MKNTKINGSKATKSIPKAATTAAKSTSKAVNTTNIPLIRDEELLELLVRKAAYLEKVLTQKNRALENAPEGKLHVIKHGKRAQFYLRTTTGEKMGKYIRKSETALIRDYAQKKYDQRAAAIISGQLWHIQRLIRTLRKQSLSDLFSLLHEDEKEYVDPICMDDADYALRWYKTNYTRLPFREGTPEYMTKNGERVRSKSEIIIANTLAEMGIPYMYECPLRLDGNYTVYPDFTVLNLRTRKTLYWEHLGMMDDSDYLENAIHKIHEYQKTGIFLGTELILTAETNLQPLNTSSLGALVQHYCF